MVSSLFRLEEMLSIISQIIDLERLYVYGTYFICSSSLLALPQFNKLNIFACVFYGELAGDRVDGLPTLMAKPS